MLVNKSIGYTKHFLLCQYKLTVFIGRGYCSNKGMPIDTEYLSRSLNKILRGVLTKTGKYIRTHSFRVIRISDLLENTDIRGVAEIIGHADMGSTKAYDRVHVNFNEHTMFDLHRDIKPEDLRQLAVFREMKDIKV